MAATASSSITSTAASISTSTAALPPSAASDAATQLAANTLSVNDLQKEIERLSLLDSKVLKKMRVKAATSKDPTTAAKVKLIDAAKLLKQERHTKQTGETFTKPTSAATATATATASSVSAAPTKGSLVAKTIYGSENFGDLKARFKSDLLFAKQVIKLAIDKTITADGLLLKSSSDSANSHAYILARVLRDPYTAEEMKANAAEKKISESAFSSMMGMYPKEFVKHQASKGKTSLASDNDFGSCYADRYANMVARDVKLPLVKLQLRAQNEKMFGAEVWLNAISEIALEQRGSE